jgi:hypothetical protein
MGATSSGRLYLVAGRTVRILNTHVWNFARGGPKSLVPGLFFVNVDWIDSKVKSRAKAVAKPNAKPDATPDAKPNATRGQSVKWDKARELACLIFEHCKHQATSEYTKVIRANQTSATNENDLNIAWRTTFSNELERALMETSSFGQALKNLDAEQKALVATCLRQYTKPLVCPVGLEPECTPCLCSYQRVCVCARVCACVRV